MNHEDTHQTNPMAPWDLLDALLTPWDLVVVVVVANDYLEESASCK